VKWCVSQDDIAFPPRLDMIKDLVLHLEKKGLGIPAPPLGKNWISQFLKRHPGWANFQPSLKSISDWFSSKGKDFV